MTKAFFEAFPGVSPDDELICDLLKHTTVTRLTMDPETGELTGALKDYLVHAQKSGIPPVLLPEGSPGACRFFYRHLG